MKIEQLIKKFLGVKSVDGDHHITEELISNFKRKCWIREVEEGDGDVRASKFSGIPFLGQDETWPICPNCRNPIQLFLQLNSEELPADCEKIWGSGILQFFYCVNSDPLCEVDSEAFFPFSKSTLLRIVQPATEPSAISKSPISDFFPAKRIVGWRETDDYPTSGEFLNNDVDLTDEQFEALNDAYPRAGEKLLGWPMWVQDVEYPDCPLCESEMQLVFQIDSNKNLPYMFGDVGCGHITQCPEHRTKLAFGWACS